MLAFLLAGVFAAAPCAPVVDVDGPGLPPGVVTAFAGQASEAVASVRARLGSTSCAPLAITIVPAMEDAPTLDPPWHLPAWAAGAAQPAQHRIVVGVTADRAVQDRHTTLVHEVAHVVVHEVVGDADVPRWLDEGIARVTAGEHGVDDLSRLAHARIGGHFLPLAALVDGFPPGRGDAALAYAEAGRAVALLEARGAATVPALLQALRTGVDVDEALVQVAGRATWQLDRDVQQSLSGWAALAVVGVETDLAMALCAAVVAFAGVRARRRLRQRIAAMDDDLLARTATAVHVALARFRHGPGEGRQALRRAMANVSSSTLRRFA